MSTKSKAKKKQTTRDFFNRPAQSFRMMGQEFKYEHIPGGQFQDILLDLLAAVLAMDNVVANALEAASGNQPAEDTEFNASVMEIAGRLLKERIFQIISEVLEYQNGHEYVSPNHLAKATRPSELARFANLIMSDDEVKDSFEEYISGLGKL